MKLFSSFKHVPLVTHLRRHGSFLVPALLLVVWIAFHIPGIQYGAQQPPLHITHVGDEQVSVNSALRVLNEKNLLAFRNREMQYYGPMFVVADLPGVAADFVWKYLTGVVQTAEEYKRYILWDWGGILLWIRATGLLSMALGLVVLYKLFDTVTLNPTRSRYLPYLAPVFVGINYFYFQYSHFAIHWSYVIPCLFLQLYTLVRIVETGGSKRSLWVIHGVATAVSFGVSYFSILFLSMWLPVLWRMWKDRSRQLLQGFLYLGGWLSVAFLLIIWWHPHAFFRIISFMGIGEPLHNIGDAQNPFVLTDTSFDFYLTQLFVNQMPIVIAFLALVALLWRKGIARSWVFWMLLLPGIMNFLLFAPAAHHEGRYNLPTLLSLILACIYAFVLYCEEKPSQIKRYSRVVLNTLFSCYVVFHLVHVGLWIHIFAKGPVELEAIRTALDLQGSGSSVLIVNMYLLGYPHTKEAYRAFAKYWGFGDIPLYREMYATPLPDDRVPLDARYLSTKDFEKNPSIVQEYDHVLLRIEQRKGEWNQFTYFDENILRNWFYRDFSPTYVVVK